MKLTSKGHSVETLDALFSRGGDLTALTCSKQSIPHETLLVELKDAAVQCVKKDSVSISRNLQLYYSLRLRIDLNRRAEQIGIKQIDSRR